MSNIFNIERFATHDGPGIRTTVFFQGCPLHCPWCANPESWDVRPVIMHEQRKCVSCHRCEGVCSSHAITFDDQWQIDLTQCNGCRRCAEVCLNEAITFSGEKMATQEIMKEVLKDQAYYQESGGGLTVSGGEPFLQTEALAALLKQAKKAGLHTAVETTGNYALACLQKLDPMIDLYLFDYKHIDSERLHQITGGDLNLIQTNLEWLATVHPEKVIVRIPVIPGFNAAQEVLISMLKRIADMGLHRVDLLPYHTLALAKHRRMHTEYTWPYPEPLQKKDLQQAAAAGEAFGLSMTIGGQDRKAEKEC